MRSHARARPATGVRGQNRRARPWFVLLVNLRPNPSTAFVAANPLTFASIVGLSSFVGGLGVMRSLIAALVLGGSLFATVAAAWVPANGPCQRWSRGDGGAVPMLVTGAALPVCVAFLVIGLMG